MSGAQEIVQVENADLGDVEVNKVSLIYQVEREGLDIAKRTSPVKEIAKQTGKERELRKVGEKIGKATEVK